MNDSHDDETLRALLRDAVADVDPRDRLADVRRRTRVRRTATGRRWLPVLVGAGAVGATVVAATFVVGGLTDETDDPDQAPVASAPPAPGPSEEPITRAAGVYFVAPTPTGPRLFREFQAVGQTADPAELALLALQRLSLGATDPDYETLWPADAFASVIVEEDRIVVGLGSEEALEAPRSPAAYLGVQQAVYTAEAAIGKALPVSFERDGRPAREVLGLPVGAQVRRDTSFSLLTPVNITDPGEELAVEEDTFVANGTMATYVRDVTWTLRQTDGAVVREGTTTPVDITGPDARATLGAPGWETRPIDVGDLPPGDYVLEASVVDTGQTSDRPEEFTDTRTITVR
ncbi:hypothetical protein DJ010_16705 [Nocardioides silvaticus]|uniref:Uncharacterized protein n=1 Tax=Nocardioides silvaticus TaxID=2201891 RepID=A0A316TB79_9ACTN|nr:GerMN domain-containing protein [Nocardioides silvaticus]PWN01680.1 hypothetical protein DJ010_16705 [Nocardioides silvaticus]